MTVSDARQTQLDLLLAPGEERERIPLTESFLPSGPDFGEFASHLLWGYSAGLSDNGDEFDEPFDGRKSRTGRAKYRARPRLNDRAIAARTLSPCVPSPSTAGGDCDKITRQKTTTYELKTDCHRK